MLMFDRAERPGKVTIFIHQRKSSEAIERELEHSNSNSDEEEGDNEGDEKQDDDEEE